MYDNTTHHLHAQAHPNIQIILSCSCTCKWNVIFHARTFGRYSNHLSVASHVCVCMCASVRKLGFVTLITASFVVYVYVWWWWCGVYMQSTLSVLGITTNKLASLNSCNFCCNCLICQERTQV